MTELGSSGDLRTLVKKLIVGKSGEEIEKACDRIFPLQNCYIRKVKVLKKPKFDVSALMEWHSAEEGTSADTGKTVVPEETVAGAGGRY